MILSQTGRVSRVSVSRVHGGPDASGPVRYDFSSNANSVGANPVVVDLIRQADLIHYPDPAYQALRDGLARWHGVSPSRILMAGSASEFIFRMTSFIARQYGAEDSRLKAGQGRLNQIASVWLPEHAYGDYEAAARAWSVPRAESYQESSLLWFCDPSSPLGQPVQDLSNIVNGLIVGQIAVLDCAYEPLRLEGSLNLSADQLDRLWQMWTPNKALGMTGVRGAYVIAPLGGEHIVEILTAIAPSWLIGAEGVAMLNAWVRDDVQTWLKDCLITLRQWKFQQLQLCQQLGWQSIESTANFFCASSPVFKPAQYLPVLREFDIKLRDAASFGLSNHVRIAVMPPDAQQKLREAWAYFERGI